MGNVQNKRENYADHQYDEECELRNSKRKSEPSKKVSVKLSREYALKRM